MKFGVLYHRNNKNIGDDIQAYASARFYPSVDYLVDRESINSFTSDNNEPVAVIMCGWYMWEKWHWPPARCIVPHMVSMHYADYRLEDDIRPPVNYEILETLGGEYFRAYQPIGCRDYFTMEKFKSLGFDSYFSGCITLTLPQLPKNEDIYGKYICIVDVDERVQKRVIEFLKDTEYEVKIISHLGTRDMNRSWEERSQNVYDLISIYRNAKCVITSRLHCALPCLTQETPVLLVKDEKNRIRFDPYKDLLHTITVKDFMNGDYDFDFKNPPPNRDDYKIIRESLEKSCIDFVEKMKNVELSTEQLDKFKFSDYEVHEWQFQMMDNILHSWLTKTRNDWGKQRKSTKTIQSLKAENKLLKKSIKDLENKNNRLEKIVNSKTVRWARKLRKIIKG